MPKSHVREEGHLKKPVKSGSTSRNTFIFSDGADVERHLHKQDNLTDGERDVLSLCTEGSATDCLNLAALTALRNQLTIKYGEGAVQPQDERLALARSWLETAPGAHTVFNIWENTTEVRGCNLVFLSDSL